MSNILKQTKLGVFYRRYRGFDYQFQLNYFRPENSKKVKTLSVFSKKFFKTFKKKKKKKALCLK